MFCVASDNCHYHTELLTHLHVCTEVQWGASLGEIYYGRKENNVRTEVRHIINKVFHH